MTLLVGKLNVGMVLVNAGRLRMSACFLKHPDFNALIYCTYILYEYFRMCVRSWEQISMFKRSGLVLWSFTSSFNNLVIKRGNGKSPAYMYTIYEYI